MSYQRQDLGAPPVVTPQYERIVGGDNTSVTLSGLEPGTTYRIRVWSTNGTSVSSGTTNKDVTTVESGEFFVDVHSETHQHPNNCLNPARSLMSVSTCTVCSPVILLSSMFPSLPYPQPPPHRAC